MLLGLTNRRNGARLLLWLRVFDIIKHLNCLRVLDIIKYLLRFLRVFGVGNGASHLRQLLQEFGAWESDGL